MDLLHPPLHYCTTQTKCSQHLIEELHWFPLVTFSTLLSFKSLDKDMSVSNENSTTQIAEAKHIQYPTKLSLIHTGGATDQFFASDRIIMSDYKCKEKAKDPEFNDSL